MAQLPTPEENGKTVLGIYAHFGSRPKDVLGANNFVAVAARRRIPISDIQTGLEFALAAGWIEETENGSLRLTEQGFSVMPESAH
jgi:hypothetical protein